MIMALILVLLLGMVMLAGMAYTGYVTPTNKTLIAGTPLVQEAKLETGTDCYAGRLVGGGTYDDDAVVCTNILQPRGFIQWEGIQPEFQPATYATAFAADDIVRIIKGDIVVKAKLATPFVVSKDQLMCNWTAGQLAGPVLPADGGVLLGIPFVKKASEYDTGIELPADMLVMDAYIDVGTLAGSSWIDVGLLSTEDGGDANGFIVHAACTAAQKVRPGATITTGTGETYIASTTRGVMLADFVAGTDNATDHGVYIEKAHRCDGTATTLSYTTSNHTVAGMIWLHLVHEGLRVVGQAEKDADGSSAAVDVQVRCLI